jgi:hypothetical protein
VALVTPTIGATDTFFVKKVGDWVVSGWRLGGVRACDATITMRDRAFTLSIDLPTGAMMGFFSSTAWSIRVNERGDAVPRDVIMRFTMQNGEVFNKAAMMTPITDPKRGYPQRTSTVGVMLNLSAFTPFFRASASVTLITGMEIAPLTVPLDGSADPIPALAECKLRVPLPHAPEPSE